MHLSPLVAWGAVPSKAVVLLLLIYCLMHFQLFVYALLCVHSRFATILKRKRKMFFSLLLSYRCIVTINVPWLFFAVQWVGLKSVILVLPDHTHSLVGIKSLRNIQQQLNASDINYWNLFSESQKKVSEYDQEIPQSQTADYPVAPRGRAAQPSRDTRKTN